MRNYWRIGVHKPLFAALFIFAGLYFIYLTRSGVWSRAIDLYPTDNMLLFIYYPLYFFYAQRSIVLWFENTIEQHLAVRRRWMSHVLNTSLVSCASFTFPLILTFIPSIPALNLLQLIPKILLTAAFFFTAILLLHWVMIAIYCIRHVYILACMIGYGIPVGYYLFSSTSAQAPDYFAVLLGSGSPSNRFPIQLYQVGSVLLSMITIGFLMRFVNSRSFQAKRVNV